MLKLCLYIRGVHSASGCILLLLLLFHTPIGADEKDEKGNREIRMIDV